MIRGELTVSGKNSTFIPLDTRPREVEVHFRPQHHHHVPCNPHHKDHLFWRVISVDEDPHIHKRIGHEHHNRQFFLFIEWSVENIREIDWFIFY